MSTQRYKITIEYMGAGFVGWQRQPDHMTIQQAIEEAIHGFCQQEVKVQVAGRTDAGVHARGQVAHFDLAPTKKPMQPFEIAKAINYHLQPHTISIIGIEAVDDEFHARFSAVNKLYRYRIINRQGTVALDKGLVWHIKKKLDAEKMHAAAQLLLGHHDFTTFRDSECQAQSPMKTLDRLDVMTRDYDHKGGQEIIIETEGKSFLHHQVRNMVGTLTLVGEGKWSAQDLKTALEAKDRTAGGPTAPADGLYMVRIDY
ncbi:MAG: tRNA pseudouridine(38-40) synthase TruA [Micavibrio sp. TMED27]|nr:tRNA pseudouridine(38-40) synthase TruA [Micavibrio sp.]OUT90363.1 MAG: tRNA pseudouridine(38-40) synthase TruA [Micavibrio sp. TMED27]|tara:strand:+ start:653 stop:1423 length:771 start_codon:yes stop_codon:yes gene_type:complete